MPERFARRILEHLADQRYEPRTAHELARDLSIPEDEQPAFEEAVRQLLEEGQMVAGSSETLLLPPPGKTMVGIFRKHERGFGFIVPDELTQHGDLFVPPNASMDAMTGDRVSARVRHSPRRGSATGKSPYTGQIVEILQRADKRYVGTLQKDGKQFVVQVDGRVLHDAVLIRDPHASNAKLGDKVVIELIEYPDRPGKKAEGVITEVLGESGEPEIETLSVIRAYGLAEKFDDAVVENARAAAREFHDDDVPTDREDLTGLLTLTIDPPDARDFDDAISLRKVDEIEGGVKASHLRGESGDEAVWELGVHIADVSHFVRLDSPLDQEAYERGNSTYLPRKVIPMLPELLSNGVCSLQDGVNRFTKSAFIYYDADGRVVGQRFSRSVIHSDKRLTYLEAQALIDDDLREAVKHTRSEAKYPRPIIQALKQMDELAKTIRKRRMSEGMIVLGLPEVELVFDEAGRVVDAQPEDDAFTHTLIEMFMVEANEAAARLFDSLGVPMIRRVHPDPDAHDVGELRHFARVAGFNIPAKPSRKELQQLLEQVRGKPAQHAVHLAVLRTLSKAEYSPILVGHFALASEHYTHFTSPIRRYPDLVVHRGLDAYLKVTDNGQKGVGSPKQRKQVARAVMDSHLVPNEDRLHNLGKHCSTTERNSEQAERELRSYLVMELLTQHLGEDFAATVTGVTGMGVFMQLNRYLVDGLVRAADLPGPEGERWQMNPNTGALTAQRSGRAITIGDQFTVRVAKVDLARRQMDLVIIEDQGGGKQSGKQSGEKSGEKSTKKKPRRQSPGARKAHEATKKVKQQSKQQAEPGQSGQSSKGKSSSRSRRRRGK
ncbi:ribonuclease R [Phycisphaerales bacterium AB-hyl4]|uniref:Ribonuclease R n=1 Tax=Natronomicrosphaera hydrolytica TaxID=3242702 RepID=A0ABV4U504_9BACT